jgi:hypothetical protein
MPSGIKSLTTISFMLITTESSSNALTVSNEGFIQGFLRTLLITQKIKSAFRSHFYQYADYNNRVLLATIRDKGSCPCPRCLIAKSKLDGLGLRRDISIRVTKFREFMADRVEIARKAIYTFARSIRSTVVENLLKDFSGVPTVVSSIKIVQQLKTIIPKAPSPECICEPSWI